MNTFERDDALVAVSAVGANQPIESSGAYVGVFTQAKHRVAKTGTTGIEFSFEAEDGAVARYMTLWVARANGERIPFAYGVLSGLMVCLGLKSISSTSTVSEEWDAAVGARVPTPIETYPDLLNRQVGVLLQREEREWEGKLRVGMRIVDFFNPATRQMPSEILAGAGATGQLPAQIAALKDRVVRASANVTGATAQTPSASPAAHRPPSAFDLSDDDIPF